MSTDFCKEEVIQTRREQKELLSLQEEIVHLASKLAATIRRQNELYETSGFIRDEYQSLVDAVEFASHDNYLYGELTAA
jgi:protein-arginine kinase activator protein McsA